MERLNQLQIEGFRRLSDLQLEMRPLCVLIGANGSGKTSVLDSLSLVSHSAAGRLKNTLSDMGGIGANLTARDSRQMSFQVSTETLDHQMMAYRLALAAQGAGYEIVNEEVQFLGVAPRRIKYIDARGEHLPYMPRGAYADLVAPRRLPEPGETAFSVDEGERTDSSVLYNMLVSIAYYHALDVRPRSAVRLPQPMRPAETPGTDGEDLVSCLYSIRETNRDRFELIEETLRAGFHDFERLDFPPVAAGTLAMTWRDKQFSKPFYMHQLSEGALRFLWLVAILQSPKPPALTLIDEPEVSLHPELLALLAELLREASARTQLIVATHSDRLVRFLEPKEVVAIDLNEDGTARAAWADTLDIDAWLKDYSLDEVWSMGRMGARS